MGSIQALKIGCTGWENKARRMAGPRRRGAQRRGQLAGPMAIFPIFPSQNVKERALGRLLRWQNTMLKWESKEKIIFFAHPPPPRPWRATEAQRKTVFSFAMGFMGLPFPQEIAWCFSPCLGVSNRVLTCFLRAVPPTKHAFPLLKKRT
jgi:hypothetical protein